MVKKWSCYQDMFCCYGEVPPILDNRGFHVQCVIVHSCVSMYPGPCIHGPSPSCKYTVSLYKLAGATGEIQDEYIYCESFIQ